MANYNPISACLLRMPIAVFNSKRKSLHPVKPASPAILVMTDLRDEPAITVSPYTTIDEALEIMKEERVRLLFVMDRDELLVGLITATDILGEKPIRLNQERNLHHAEVEVRDIMTPYQELEVLSISNVMTSRVGDIILTLQNAGRQHALVTDIHPRTESEAIRGIFSTSQISKQLGEPVSMKYSARNFSELGMALNS
jgi:CBS domain containing-hemolysin-like protein